MADTTNNTGDWNTGDRNAGNLNTGDWNTGDRNTGNVNTGNWNTGNRNAGDRNTGDNNTGNRNTGDWNTGNRNAGYLILFAPHAFAPQCQYQSRWSPSPLVFLPISTFYRDWETVSQTQQIIVTGKQFPSHDVSQSRSVSQSRYRFFVFSNFC